MPTVHELAQLSTIDEEDGATAIAEWRASEGWCTRTVTRDEPKARGDRRTVKEVRREIHDAVDKLGLDDSTSYLVLARLTRVETSIGEHKPGDSVRCEVMNDVLDPRVVRVARRRNSVLPSDV